MKKLLAILAIAGAMAACNNSSEGSTTKDTTTVDTTIKPVEPTPDTTGLKTDTTVKDTTIKK